MSNKKINYQDLALWIKSLKGQNIVCENTKAEWLPFVPLVAMNGVQHKTMEAIWTNYHTHFNNIQQELILI